MLLTRSTYNPQFAFPTSTWTWTGHNHRLPHQSTWWRTNSSWSWSSRYYLSICMYQLMSYPYMLSAARHGNSEIRYVSTDYDHPKLACAVSTITTEVHFPTPQVVSNKNQKSVRYRSQRWQNCSLRKRLELGKSLICHLGLWRCDMYLSRFTSTWDHIGL